MWQHTQNLIDSWINEFMDTIYQKLNEKTRYIGKTHKTINNTKKNTHTTHSRLINPTNVTFTKEHPIPEP